MQTQFDFEAFNDIIAERLEKEKEQISKCIEITKLMGSMDSSIDELFGMKKILTILKNNEEIEEETYNKLTYFLDDKIIEILKEN